MTQQVLTYFLGSLTIASLLIGSLVGLNWLLGRLVQLHPEKKLQKQLIMLIATLILTIAAIALLPLDDSLRGQILSLLGILLSATIALSATTFLGNALAGILLRNLRSFKIGDFIYINDHFGRVSGRGLFHLEIQTRDRDLLTLPNLYVANNPVKVTRDSGTIVSTEVSLGYDVSRVRVEELLLDAARAAELEDPFVLIVSLGDFSVVYRINGLLGDVNTLISVRSRLNGQVLDCLHKAAIEIVSPSFMNTRNVEQSSFIPRVLVESLEQRPTKHLEDIVFDKAEQAETLEEQKGRLAKLEQQLQELEKTASEGEEQAQEKAQQQIVRLTKERDRLDQKVSRGAEELAAEKHEKT